ncbi:hypothetical protein P5F47_06210 [Clostridium perfringens]|nr:hypothetical protein [Clostridium perfringens]
MNIVTLQLYSLMNGKKLDKDIIIEKLTNSVLIFQKYNYKGELPRLTNYNDEIEFLKNAIRNKDKYVSLNINTYFVGNEMFVEIFDNVNTNLYESFYFEGCTNNEIPALKTIFYEVLENLEEQYFWEMVDFEYIEDIVESCFPNLDEIFQNTRDNFLRYKENEEIDLELASELPLLSDETKNTLERLKNGLAIDEESLKDFKFEYYMLLENGLY